MRFITVFLVLLSFSASAEEHTEKVKGDIERLIQSVNEYMYSDLDRAIVSANEARIKAEQLGDSAIISNVLLSLGRSYVHLGSFDMAFETFYLAGENCPKANRRLFASINLNISTLYKSLNETNKAFEFIDTATVIYTELRDTVGIAACLNARGLIFVSIGANDDAELVFKKTLALNRKLNDINSIAKNLNNLGLYKGDTEEKIQLLNEAVRINQLMGRTWSLAENYNNLGTQYFFKKDYTAALEVLKLAMYAANNLSAKELICDNFRYQSWVYEAMGNYKEAFNNLGKLYELEKDLLSERKIRDVEMRVAAHRAEKQKQELNLKKQELQIRVLRHNMVLVLVLGGFLLLALFYIMLRIRQRKQLQILEAEKKFNVQRKQMMIMQLEKTKDEFNRVRSELDYAKRSITNIACYVRSKNELLLKIKEMIKDVAKDLPSDMKIQLKKINLFISQYQNKDNELGTLLQEVEQINTEFIERLSALHPDLSKNEKQLAFLLRIDLSTKEIALLIGSTPKTVNMARYRLRQKLNLENDEKLNAYMQSI